MRGRGGLSEANIRPKCHRSGSSQQVDLFISPFLGSFPARLLPFGFFNGWAGIISRSACTAQDVVFGELRWCSNGCDLGRVPQQCSLMYGPRGRIYAPLCRREAEWAPTIIFRIYFKLMVCVCEREREFLFFLTRWKRPEGSYADLCSSADVVFIVNDEEMFCL